MRDLRLDIRDHGAVAQALAATRPAVVYHLAAQASVAISMREPELDIATNVLGTVQLALAARAAGVPRFVFVSTGGALVGEPATLPVTEHTPEAPESVYGASKLAAERYLALLLRDSDTALSVVRPGNIYGPAQNPHGEAGVVAIFAARMLAGEPVTIFGDGSQQRDYVYVDDVVDAIVRAATAPPDTCVIGTGYGTSTRAIFDVLARLTRYPHPPQLAPERPGDIQRIWLDSARARERWGWQPRTPLDVGLARTVDWFRAHASG
ncbi:MAG: NAD-dependent epimerase/dehydratase family protein [Chloroflexi bacterium]|nr:NAD-dependent epimerase/dehydratase family protein [Chloroflexota bacterium]